MATSSSRIAHLAWAIEARARNQRTSLKLLTLFSSYRSKWTTKNRSKAAQALLSAVFSLWRAAFLAEKTGDREHVFDAGAEFLERLIADNAISYPQDRKSNEWTFNYYTKNARSALQELHDHSPELVEPYEDIRTRTPVERWNYCQDLLDRAIDAFSNDLSAPSPAANLAQQKKAKLEAKEVRKRNRAKSKAFGKEASSQG